ncbi:TetR/AcrR family transcriptional regulator [Cellulosilyticum sp. I15G10I2]|uniref:TetR/AcrR family transcriptional regulator n=1 Tax=Cellulosilyticum sp. I15G10I2 TaxID=1892843 RepID=UPI00085C9313|nr:TetR/AcrR family transcriptional regulator [Cellulosilyticum sp. I15G10I2]
MGNVLLHRKISIVLATVDVINEYGINGLSTREVAKRVGISEAAIFKHFKSKSDLLYAVLDHFSHYDIDVIASIRSKKLDPIEAIVCFIDTYAAYYENYPAITALTQNNDVLRYDPNLSEKIQDILFSRTDFIAQMLKQAQCNGKIKADLDSEDIAVMIMGIAREWCLNWRLRDYSFSLRERMLASLKIVLEALVIKF